MILLILIYILSTLLVWRFMNIAYSEKGRWSGLDMDLGGVIITFTPVVNTMAVFVLGSPYPDSPKTNKFWNKIFGIKK